MVGLDSRIHPGEKKKKNYPWSALQMGDMGTKDASAKIDGVIVRSYYASPHRSSLEVHCFTTRHSVTLAVRRHFASHNRLISSNIVASRTYIVTALCIIYIFVDFLYTLSHDHKW